MEETPPHNYGLRSPAQRERRHSTTIPFPVKQKIIVSQHLTYL